MKCRFLGLLLLSIPSGTVRLVHTSVIRVHGGVLRDRAHTRGEDSHIHMHPHAAAGCDGFPAYDLIK